MSETAVPVATHHMVRYQCSPAFPNQWRQTYWFVVEGDEQAARAEFDRINTITPQEAPYLRESVSRGYELRGIHPCDERGN
jgi:hypothetical protein